MFEKLRGFLPKIFGFNAENAPQNDVKAGPQSFGNPTVVLEQSAKDGDVVVYVQNGSLVDVQETDALVRYLKSELRSNNIEPTVGLSFCRTGQSSAPCFVTCSSRMKILIPDIDDANREEKLQASYDRAERMSDLALPTIRNAAVHWADQNSCGFFDAAEPEGPVFDATTLTV